MRIVSLVLAAVVAVSSIVVAAPEAKSQVVIQLGRAPQCPYGYYDYAPYSCSPYGYYGPEWFTSGVFIGAGPWFHGHRNFSGHVDNRYDPRQGYNGQRPNAGERPQFHPDHNRGFQGNEQRDGHGNARGGGEQHGGEHRR
jgi:hypothetical protein